MVKEDSKVFDGVCVLELGFSHEEGRCLGSGSVKVDDLCLGGAE